VQGRPFGVEELHRAIRAEAARGKAA